MTDREHPVILIHGAWQGSWTFDLLVPLLSERGLRPVAVDLPGNGVDDTPPEAVTLRTYLDHLAAVVDDLGGRATVVGHSGGGIVATAFAEHAPERVSSVIYLAGMCLTDGRDFGAFQEQVAGPGQVFGVSGDIVVSEDGSTSTVSAEAAITYFLHDADRSVAEQLVARLTPQPEGGRLIASPTTAERFGRIPKLYIEALDDRSMILAAQRAMQAFVPDMPVVSIEAGHVPQFTRAPEVAAAIAEFVSGLGAVD